MLETYWVYILAGAACSLLLGMTGCGGGAFMTPVLILLGQNPGIAVGTDLLYASITKSVTAWRYHKLQQINWRVIGLLSVGSVPSTLFTTLFFHTLPPHQVIKIIQHGLGIMLFVSAFFMLFKNYFRETMQDSLREKKYTPLITVMTILSGGLLGLCITMTSVGAGSIGVVLLFLLYPRLSPLEIVGTDLAQAVPVTLLAGLGHLTLGHIDFSILLALLMGAIPSAFFATYVALRIPEKLLRISLALILSTLGCNILFN